VNLLNRYRFRRLVDKSVRLGNRPMIMPIEELRLAVAFAELPCREEVVTNLIGELFDHQNMHVRRIAVIACRKSGAFGVPGLKEALTRKLADPEGWVRYDAAWAILEAKYDSSEIRACLAALADGISLPADRERVRRNLGDADLQAKVRARETLDALLAPRTILASLGISLETISERELALYPESTELVVAEIGENGREHLLVPAAAAAWGALRDTAKGDGVVIRIVSAFRSVERQAEIVRAKLARGQSLDEILRVSAPPGYSEHHSGRALDVTTDGARPLELEFEHTAAFQWLERNAGRFGFHMSYPRQNRYGYMYEPWHWCFRGEGSDHA
jgi:D-alanyl-D-alanine carboxypeptidase